MSKIRTFDLYSGDNIIGEFLLANEVECSVVLKNGLDISNTPYDFYKEYLVGKREFTGKQVDYWIQTRILPAGRHNINEFLRWAGLTEYNPLNIFLFLNGEYTQDNFWIKERGK